MHAPRGVLTPPARANQKHFSIIFSCLDEIEIEKNNLSKFFLAWGFFLTFFSCFDSIKIDKNKFLGQGIFLGGFKKFEIF